MRGNIYGRLERLERRSKPEADPNPMAKPIAPEDLAFLQEYERIAGHTTVAERHDPLGGRELVRLAAQRALGPFGLDDGDIEEYADEVHATLANRRGEG
jgi:hypothetical protein